MSPSLLILVIAIIANLPWVTERLLVVIPLRNGKSSWLRLLELIIYYILSLMIASMAEMRTDGGIHPQDWEFFVTTLSGFLVLAVPGVVYRYQWLPLKQK